MDMGKARQDPGRCMTVYIAPVMMYQKRLRYSAKAAEASLRLPARGMQE